MQFLALVIFLVVSAFGGYLYKQKWNKKTVSYWFSRIHGVAGVIGLIVLFVGLARAEWSDWGWISFGLFGVFIAFAVLLFEKIFKNTKTPMLIIAAHGLAAIACTGVLTYSLVFTN